MSNQHSVFQLGQHQVKLFSTNDAKVRPPCSSPSSSSPPPPRPVMVSTPTEEGKFPVLVLLHGYLLYNNFYSQLAHHIASHGFIVVAPQLYTVAGPDATGDINSTASVINWLSIGLHSFLPIGVKPNLSKIAIAGHSRGGKAAFGLALGTITTATINSNISVLIAIDPVDGMDENNKTNPPILTGQPRSLDLKIPTLVLGCELSEQPKNPMFPPCAPKGVNHRNFFEECMSACHLVAKDYGHLDMLDDETKGFRGMLSRCLCKNGKERGPMRRFVGGVTVAFMKMHLKGEAECLQDCLETPESMPVVLSDVCLQ